MIISLSIVYTAAVRQSTDTRPLQPQLLLKLISVQIVNVMHIDMTLYMYMHDHDHDIVHK